MVQKQEARLGKFRTMLGVPLLRDDMVIGVIAIARWIVEPYTDKEILLVTRRGRSGGDRY